MPLAAALKYICKMNSKLLEAKVLEAKVLQYQTDQEYKRTPLMWAARAKEAEVITFLLSCLSKTQVQEELDKQDTWWWTPLH